MSERHVHSDPLIQDFLSFFGLGITVAFGALAFLLPVGPLAVVSIEWCKAIAVVGVLAGTTTSAIGTVIHMRWNRRQARWEREREHRRRYGITCEEITSGMLIEWEDASA